MQSRPYHQAIGTSCAHRLDSLMKPWSKRLGEKVIITRRASEDLVHHLENPDMFAPNQYIQDAMTIREQLEDRMNVHKP